MKKLLQLVAVLLLCLAAPAWAQNWSTISASNITDLNQNKLAAGQLCFLGTDQNDNPVSFSVGGGGQILKRSFCAAIANGAVAAFTVPNPANTSPSGIYYRVTVKDVSTGLEVLRYSQVTFSGGTFSFDNYAPITLGSFAPLAGNAVSGNLSVSGNASITGSLTAGSLNPTVISSGQFTSSTASPAGAGVLRLASSDAIDWRNNANTTNIALAKTGAASGGVPADALDASGFGGLKLPSPAISAEAAAPSGVAGSDVLYADSTAHRWKMVNNSGSADTVLGAATTDTLQNKSLTGVGSGNAVTLLNVQPVSAALTGNSTDQTIYTYTIPANTVGAGKGFRITFRYVHLSGSAVVSYKLILGSTTLLSWSSADTTAQGNFRVEEFNTAGVQNSQFGSAFGFQNVVMTTGGTTTAAENLAVSTTLKLTFNVASPDTVIGAFWLVELIQ